MIIVLTITTEEVVYYQMVRKNLCVSRLINGRWQQFASGFGDLATVRHVYADRIILDEAP